MLDHPTLDQLKTLRLDGMAPSQRLQAIACRAVESFAVMQKQDGTAALSHAEWLGLLIRCPASDL